MKHRSSNTETDNKTVISKQPSSQNGQGVSLENGSTAHEDKPGNLKIGIIGGGLMGLALGYRLTKIGAEVKVFEREDQPGGLSTYYNFGKFFWDKFYHVIVPTDGSLIRLIENIGLGDQLNWSRAYTGYYVNKSFYSLNNAKEFLLFPLLNIWDKVRLVFTIFYGSRIKNWKRLENYTVKEWLIRMGGKKNFDKFWAPLLMAKLGENYKKVSGVFIWTYISRLFKAREHPVEKDYMGYVTGGYRTVFTRLEELLNAHHSSLLLNTTVKHIEPSENGGIEVEYDDTRERFDKVIFTAPLNVLEQVTSTALCEVTKKETPIEYMGVVCLVLTTKKQITPYYVLNIGDTNSPFTGVIGISSLVDLEQTSGEYLTYFPKYIAADHPYWSKSDEELKEIFIDGVFELYPELDRSDILSMHLNRAFKVQPLQVLNYSEIIPKTKTNHPDFYVLNTSQFVKDSVNNNSVVTHVNEFMDQFEHELKIKTSP